MLPCPHRYMSAANWRRFLAAHPNWKAPAAAPCDVHHSPIAAHSSRAASPAARGVVPPLGAPGAGELTKGAGPSFLWPWAFGVGGAAAMTGGAVVLGVLHAHAGVPVDAKAVSEPSSLALLIVPFAALIWAHWRRA